MNGAAQAELMRIYSMAEWQNDCLVIPGLSKRYPTYRIPGGKTTAAHRRVAELVYGPCPEGKEVMHKCHNMRCVNADHLEYGTRLENMRQAAVRKVANNRAKVGALKNAGSLFESFLKSSFLESDRDSARNMIFKLLWDRIGSAKPLKEGK